MSVVPGKISRALYLIKPGSVLKFTGDEYTAFTGDEDGIGDTPDVITIFPLLPGKISLLRLLFLRGFIFCT